MQTLQEPVKYRFSFLHLGFRPFFLFAGFFAFISMSVWLWLFQSQTQSGHVLTASVQLSNLNWHAHEMIFGYAVAVIAGFLLTAIKNWTGVQTLNGVALLVLALSWLLARCMPFIDQPYAIQVMAWSDLAFNLLLVFALLYPIAKVKQWKQMTVWALVLCLLVSNTLFYLGVFQVLESGISWGIHSGIYIVIAFIALMGRRVIPFFIEKGVQTDSPVTLTNYKWLDISSPVLLFIFILFEVFLKDYFLAGFLSVVLFLLHAIRLKNWYSKGIWNKPLLWILYVAYAWIVLGFALKSLTLFLPLNPGLSIHAFTFGAIGLMTLGMMARVALGHTGRNVFEPPAILSWIFVIAVLGSVVRVLFPLFLSEFYVTWIGLSQILWLLSFGLFIVVYTPVLLKPRIDGKYG